jgi:hypothetical protein
MSIPPAARRRYLAKYLILDGDTLVYSGRCEVISDPMQLDDPNPGVRGFFHGITAQTVRQSCDQQGDVPVGQVVIVGLEESDEPASTWTVGIPLTVKYV